MNFNEFLDENQYPVLILQWLELKKSTYCSLDQLVELLGISKFKTSQYLEDLNKQLSKIDSDSKIDIYENNEIRIRNIDNYIVKKLRAEYLLESELFQLLHDTVHYELSIDEFAENRFLSRSKSFNKRKLLIEKLRPFHLKYKKGKIIGDEKYVRSFIFSLYFNFFYGLHNPFGSEVVGLTQKIVNIITEETRESFSLTQKAKLEFLVSIMVVRINNKHFIINRSDSDKLEKTEGYYKFSNLFVIPEDVISLEWEYLQEFLFSEGITENKKYSFDEYKIKKISTQFVEGLLKRHDENLINELSLELTRIAIKYRLFPMHIDSFNQDRSFNYFEENYPSMVESVDMLVATFNSMFPDQLNQSNLYYDLFFSAIKIIPIDLYEEKIYVCVDFTQGINYTEFVTNQIRGFNEVNIIVQERINGFTDLFISDFPIMRLSCSQVIWKEPPNANDWEDFGNEIIKIKKEKWRNNE